MTRKPHFYAVIIGSEILNRRRVDQHFDYLSSALEKKGFHLFASFTIKDDETLISNTFELIKNDAQAIMFCFGGIGSTPDDLTRQLSANVFANGKLYRNESFAKDIEKRLGERAYPHPIKMSDLPQDAGLLFNPVNNMSGFHLAQRYFFMPGFPEMAQPMMDDIINNSIPQAQSIFSKGFVAECGEGRLIQLMTEVDKSLELSSLPMMNDGNPKVEFSLSGEDLKLIEAELKIFTDFLDTQEVPYTLF